MNAIDLQQQQINLEQKMFDDGVRIWLKNQERHAEQGAASQQGWNRRLMQYLVVPLADSITAYLDALKGKPGRRSKGAYILNVTNPKEAAYIGIRTLLDQLGSNKEKTAAIEVKQLARTIGSRIEDNIRFTRLEDAAPQYVERVYDSLKRAFSHKYSHQAAVLAAAERRLLESAKTRESEYAFNLEAWVSWSQEDQIQVGLLVLDLMERALTVNDEPFISVESVFHDNNKSQVLVTLSQGAAKWCEEYREEVGKMFPQFAPCVIPPRDWTGPFKGGFHTPEVSSRLPLVKSGRYAHRKKLTKEQMPKVYQAVNYLQRTAWQVNVALLDAVDEMFQSDKSYGVLPDREAAIVPDSPIPDELSHLKGQDLLAVLPEDVAHEFSVWKGEVRDLFTADRRRQHDLLKYSNIICQAREYRIYENIYFVWNLDSRSRVYCNSSRLSPQGEDIAKALIRLSVGNRLGLSGRDWLAVHGCGVWAEAVKPSNTCVTAWDGRKADKIPKEWRVKSIELMEADILDYAACPSIFTGWMDADKPWQFLAFCIEWARLREWEDAGNDTEDFVSHIPVALDGSCSGIQHYSAMLRDPMGGRFVNLTGSEFPQDIYGEVANRTVAGLEAIRAGEYRLESKSLLEAQQDRMAGDWLDYGISRNFTKKPVMTLPYGSTQLTARDGVYAELIEKITKAKEYARKHNVPYMHPHPFADVSTQEAETYQKNSVTLVTGVMWSKIGEVVPAAREAMRFIKKVTGVVAEANCALYWTTPTGFIVEQSIMETEEEIIDTALLGRLQLRTLNPTNKIDVNRMKSASAPNFVHSYDATHLQLVCCAAEDNGIPGLACIHDSFGATAGDTELLSYLLRATFIQMYEECDPLASFLEDAEKSSGIAIEVDMPMIGALDLKEMYNSEYCFM